MRNPRLLTLFMFVVVLASFLAGHGNGGGHPNW